MTAKIASFVASAAVLIISGCSNCGGGLPEAVVEPKTLTGHVGADDEGSCVGCHPRQYAEWAGSSHNYGGGLDPTYQSLELVANYYLRYASANGRHAVRQNLLCVGCHSPSANAYESNDVSSLNPNSAFRLGLGDVQDVNRELERPVAFTEGLLMPIGRATELLTDPTVDMETVYARRRLTFQGITCDTCHKARSPFDDLTEVDERDGYEAPICTEETLACGLSLLEQCINSPRDARCARISRGGHHDEPPRYERGIANVALVYERDGSTRYGPVAPEALFPNAAHGYSQGDLLDVSFPGEPADVRPYISTGQFCGACHDVRLPPSGDLEPIHRESFLRLENLYTEWFTSPLNLYRDPEHNNELVDPEDNPYLDADGNPRRVTCQDCHMGLFPYAPPGIYPGEYTAGPDNCNPDGTCGEFIGLSAQSSLRDSFRPKVSTHQMNGPDIAMGFMTPDLKQMYSTPPRMLPASLMGANNPRRRYRDPPFSDADDTERDSDYNLPVNHDARREQLLEQSAAISLAGTPQTIDTTDTDCSDGLCCDSTGMCNLPVKAWLTNINGGHQVAAGFSQERQIWVELTVQDLGDVDTNGVPRVVDCALVDMADLYTSEKVVDGRYPRWEEPVRHDVISANDVMNRLFGIPTGTTTAHHEDICRGLSGHLLDKPHHETNEILADGNLHDEDVWLHRIGNTLPQLADGTLLASWHIADLGLDADLAGEPVAARVGRADQFHIPGNDAFACELSLEKPVASTIDPTWPIPTVSGDAIGATTIANMIANPLLARVTDTSDERLEILYPFPEFAPLMPEISASGGGQPVLHAGERFGLVYPTNIFYRVCGCPPDPNDPNSSCEIDSDFELPGVTNGKAQVPWVATFPVLPFDTTGLSDEAADNAYHFPLTGRVHQGRYQKAKELYGPLMTALNIPGGTKASEAFTFVPLNANHMPNNRALKFYKPQRHYWDIRVNSRTVKGPIRVSVKMWFRHFPPEFLRLMARAAKGAYLRSDAQGVSAEFFPNGPLMIEGRADSDLWPDVGNVDNLRRILMDEAVMFIDVRTSTGSAQANHPLIKVPDRPTFAEHVQPILHDHCLPCHSDVLRHGGLILGYDKYPQWDVPGGQPADTVQNARDNLVNAPSARAPGEKLVVPNQVGESYLMDTLMDDQPQHKVRRMPLKTDRLSERELETIRKWIETGAT